MNLQKLLSIIARYKVYLQSKQAKDDLYKWESLKNFSGNWDTEAIDLAAMYDAAFQNMTSRRLWVGHDFYPKEIMLKLMRTEPEYIRLALRDLFNENKTLSDRVARFLFYCDEVFTIYKTQNPRSRENHHYHNHQVVMMYLAFRFPEKYSLYHPSNFVQFLTDVDAKNISATHDLERFAKVTKVIYTFMKKDEALQNLIRERLDPTIHFQGAQLLAVQELMCMNAQSWQ